jgi:branched-chain amino acid transport system substrate-binding protein
MNLVPREKSTLPAVLRLAFLLVLATALSGCGRKDTTEPIAIGVVLPASGPNEAVREHVRQGIRMAVDEANKDNLIVGRKVEVVMPASGSEPEGIRATAQRLVTVNKVIALLGGTDLVHVEALAQVAESSKVPVVAGVGAADHSGNPYLFEIGISASQQSQVLASLATRELNLKTVVVLTSNREASGSSNGLRAAAFEREFRKNGGSLLGDWSFKTPAEIKGLIERIQNARPDGVLLAGSVEDLHELRRAGLDEKQLVLLSTMEGSLPALQREPLSNPVFTVTAFMVDKQTQEFERKYRERFQEPPDVDAALAYDSARFLFEGLRQAKALEAAKVAEALTGLEHWDSLTGPLLLDKEHRIRRTAYVVRVENGKTTTVRSERPGAADKESH